MIMGRTNKYSVVVLDSTDRIIGTIHHHGPQSKIRPVLTGATRPPTAMRPVVKLL